MIRTEPDTRGPWGQRPIHGLLAAAAITLLACGRDMEPTVAAGVRRPVSLTVSPPTLSLIVGGSGTFSARAVDAKGFAVPVSFVWSSADPIIATVGQSDGSVVAVSPGSTTVTATAGTLSATATVSVRPPDPPVAVSLSPPALTLIAGSVERLVARATDSTGGTANVSFEWSSADPVVATVGRTDGIVTAIAVGATTVTVAVGSLRATATVSVIAMGLTGSSFAFTRTTEFSPGNFTSDVLSFSIVDRTTQSLPRTSQFPSIAAPAWSPDGTQLAVEVIHSWFDVPEYGLSYNSDLYVLGAATPAGAPWRALTTNGLSTSPSWSPDGKRIAYLQQHGDLLSRNDIFIIDAAGDTPVRLTRTEGEYGTPRWSPDGTRLAFSAAAGNNFEIFTVNADGSGLTNVTRNSAFDYDPSWSPDGARLAFVSNRDSPPGNSSGVDVFVVDADGSNVRRLTSLGGYCRGPAWSPDGRQIIFSLRDALFVMDADGSSLAGLTTPPNGSRDSAPTWRR